MKKFKWQDWVLMIGNFVFAPSLIVSIMSGAEIPLGTTLPTALVLTVFVATFVTLKLYLSAFACTMTAICWYILVF